MEKLSQWDRVFEAALTVVRGAYLEPLCRQLGRSPYSLSDSERAEMLAPYAEQLRAHSAQMREIARQLGLLAVAQVSTPAGEPRLEVQQFTITNR